jgi:hypothetical protein
LDVGIRRFDELEQIRRRLPWLQTVAHQYEDWQTLQRRQLAYAGHPGNVEHYNSGRKKGMARCLLLSPRKYRQASNSRANKTGSRIGEQNVCDRQIYHRNGVPEAELRVKCAINARK